MVTDQINTAQCTVNLLREGVILSTHTVKNYILTLNET